MRTFFKLERVGNTYAETGLAIAAIVDADVAELAIRRPVFIQLVGNLEVVLLRVRFIVVAFNPFGTARINIVQLGTPVAEHVTGPRIATVDFIILFPCIRRVASVVITITGSNVETIIEAVLHAQIRLVD